MSYLHKTFLRHNGREYVINQNRSNSKEQEILVYDRKTGQLVDVIGVIKNHTLANPIVNIYPHKLPELDEKVINAINDMAA